jgi:aryl-alcohol dehydrogenase-like predicted oxidoreductase
VEYTKLGRTGLFVSKICLGTANFGRGESSGFGDWGVVPEKEAYKIMDFALENGINFFDTANVYGGLGHRGLSEEILGRWFQTGGNRRERVVLGTKVGRIFEQSILDGPNNVEGFSLYKIRRHIEASLKRLQTDKVELLQMHILDKTVDWDEIWEAFEGVVRSGKADYIGSSNHPSWEIVRAQYEAKRRGFMGFVNEQHLYNPLVRQPEYELLPMAREMGVGITLFSPLFRGLLGIDTENLNKRPMTAEAAAQFEARKPQLEAYSKLCREIGEEEANVTLAWELAHPEITSVIVAPCTIDDLKSMLRAVEIRLDDEIMARIHEIFPMGADASPYGGGRRVKK